MFPFRRTIENDSFPKPFNGEFIKPLTVEPNKRQENYTQKSVESKIDLADETPRLRSIKGKDIVLEADTKTKGSRSLPSSSPVIRVR